MDVLLDTHALVWSLAEPQHLSGAARAAIERADGVFVSPISFYEIAQKARIGKWPEGEKYLPNLRKSFLDRGGQEAPLDTAVCVLAGSSPWKHRDPFDRIIAATCMCHRLTLISKDARFDEISEAALSSKSGPDAAYSRPPQFGERLYITRIWDFVSGLAGG